MNKFALENLLDTNIEGYQYGRDEVADVKRFYLKYKELADKTWNESLCELNSYERRIWEEAIEGKRQIYALIARSRRHPESNYFLRKAASRVFSHDTASPEPTIEFYIGKQD